MKAYLLIALGSGLGGVARHWLTTFITARAAPAFPWGTLTVNIIGSFLIGLIASLPAERIAAESRQFLTVGVMGGFTTFSAFSAQSMSLLQSGKPGLCLTYVLLSVGLCILACYLGFLIVQTRG